MALPNDISEMFSLTPRKTNSFESREAAEALMRKGGDELQQELSTAVEIKGYKGSFRTEFEILAKAKNAENNAVNLIVDVNGVNFLWSLKTRPRGDGELQLGVVVSALSPAGIGCDISIKVIPSQQLATSEEQTPRRSTAPTWKGVCLPYENHERRMHQRNGLLVLYPTNKICFGPLNAEGKARIVFSTNITTLGQPAGAFLRSLQAPPSLNMTIVASSSSSSSSPSQSTSTSSNNNRYYNENTTTVGDPSGPFSSSNIDDSGGEATPVAWRGTAKKLVEDDDD